MILWRGGAAQNGAGIGVERTSIAHPASPTPFYGSTYSYDAVGRLGSVTNDRSGDAFTYGYQDQSFGLVRSVTGPVHTVTNDWEAHRNILDKKTNGPVTAPISSYDYTVNDLGQRTNLATDGSAFSVQPALTWTYNARGELVEIADASASDFDRAYQYDGIGNREKTAEGLLVDLPASANYQADALNQYSSVTLGSTALSPVHDLDGNATSYPLPADGSANSTLVWDGENRLVSATTPNNVVTTFTYDYLSRRMTKATTTGATTATECYLYDGWNPIVEKRAPTGSSFDEIRLYTWGTDLSGSSQGAGGVAGLLAIEKQGNIFSSSPTTDHYYPTYDGNGNVSEYLDSASLVVAHFEYDPFGNTTVNTDTAGLFDILFSTKKRDLGTGLYYYGYRYYDPVTGRWPSRDPIGERGGINLYGMVGNEPISYVDGLGLKATKEGGVKSIRDALPQLLKECDCCVPKDQVEACKAEAKDMVKNLADYWLSNFGKGPRDDAGDSVGGYMCWSWANGFKRGVLDKKKGKIWASEFEKYYRKNNPRVHYTVRIKIANPKPAHAGISCDGFSLDNGFGGKSCIHGGPCVEDFPVCSPYEGWEHFKNRPNQPEWTDPKTGNPGDGMKLPRPPKAK